MVYVAVGVGFVVAGVGALLYARRLSAYLTARQERLNEQRSGWRWINPSIWSVRSIQVRAGLVVVVGTFTILLSVGRLQAGTT